MYSSDIPNYETLRILKPNNNSLPFGRKQKPGDMSCGAFRHDNELKTKRKLTKSKELCWPKNGRPRPLQLPLEICMRLRDPSNWREIYRPEDNWLKIENCLEYCRNQEMFLENTTFSNFDIFVISWFSKRKGKLKFEKSKQLFTSFQLSGKTHSPYRKSTTEKLEKILTWLLHIEIWLYKHPSVWKSTFGGREEETETKKMKRS